MRPIVIASPRRPPAILRFLLSIPLILAAYFLAGFVFGLLGYTLLARALYSTLLLVMLLWGFGTLLFSLDQVRSSLLAACGLPLEEAGRDATLGIAFGVGAVSLVVGVVAVLGQVHFDYVGAPPATLLLSLWTLAAAAMVEETTFRGYPMHRLMEAVGTPVAVAVTSSLFGVAHLRNPHASWWGAVNTAEIGALLALAYVRTRALWLSWGIHFGWNVALGLGYGLVVSGYNFSAIVRGNLRGPRWLTGGEYGIEASATATAVNALLLITLLVVIKPRPAPEIVVRGKQAPLHIASSAEENSAIQPSAGPATPVCRRSSCKNRADSES